jgi:hypothetical protein
MQSLTKYKESHIEGQMDKKQLLAEAVKAAGEQSKAKQLWVIDPMIENIAMAFAEYVGMVSVGQDGKPLLVGAIKRAMDAYEGFENSPRAARAAFVRSLLANSQEVFAQQVIVETPRGDIAWMPFVSSVTDFLAQYAGAQVDVERQECKMAEPITSTFLMTKIIPASLLDQASLAELIGDPNQLA